MTADVILLTGLAAAGKSTLAHLWVSTTGREAVVIDHDEVRSFHRGRQDSITAGWSEAVERDWVLARDACAGIAQVYVGAQLPVMIEAFASPDDERLGWPAWQQLLEPTEVRPVVLLPEFHVAQARNARRPDERRLGEDVLQHNYEVARRWREVDSAIIIDNTNQTPTETLGEMLRGLVAESRPRSNEP